LTYREKMKRMAKDKEAYLVVGRVEDGNQDPMKPYGVKRLFANYLLPYWSVWSSSTQF
jgi:hypothetical protein